MKHLLLHLLIGTGLAVTAVLLIAIFRHAGFFVLTVILLAFLCVLMVSIAFLLDRPRLPSQPLIGAEAAELEKHDLLIRTAYRVDRAFRVHPGSQDSPHYFLELEGGGILHLSGRYLLAYEPGPDVPRYFPCTRFTLRRHSQLGHVVDILCDGCIIEPEVETPPFSQFDFARGLVPADGEILHGINFDQLREQRNTPRLRFR